MIDIAMEWGTTDFEKEETVRPGRHPSLRRLLLITLNK